MIKKNKNIILVLLLVIALYLPMLFQFSNLFGFEDYWIFSNIRKIDSFKNLIVFFIADQHGEFKGQCEYRPVIPIFYYLNYKLFGANAHSLHIILFIKFILLLFVLYKFTKNLLNSEIALLTVLVFAFFPALSTSFIISSNSGDLIAAFFIMLTLYFKQIKQRICFIMLFFILANLTKENAYILSILLILYDIIIDKKNTPAAIKDNIIFVLFTGGVFILRTIIMGGIDEDTVFGQQNTSIIYELFNLINLYLKTYDSILFFITLIISAVIFFVSNNNSKKYFRILILLVFWFFLFMLPLLGKSIGIYVHRYIIPAIPFSIFIALLLYNCGKIFKSKFINYIFIFVIIGISYLKLYDNHKFWQTRFSTKQECFEKLVHICSASEYDNFLIIKTDNEFSQYGYIWDYFYTHGIKFELAKQNKKVISTEDIIVNNIESDKYQIFLIKNNNIKLISYNELLDYYSEMDEYLKFKEIIKREIFDYSDLLKTYYRNIGDYGILKGMHNLKIYDEILKISEQGNNNVYKQIWLEYISGMRLNKFNMNFWNDIIDLNRNNSEFDFFLSKLLYNILKNNSEFPIEKLKKILKSNSLPESNLLLSVFYFANDKFNNSVFQENARNFNKIGNNYDFINKYFNLLVNLNIDDIYFEKLLFDNIKINNKSDLIFYVHLKYKKLIFNHFRNYFAI